MFASVQSVELKIARDRVVLWNWKFMQNFSPHDCWRGNEAASSPKPHLFSRLASINAIILVATAEASGISKSGHRDLEDRTAMIDKSNIKGQDIKELGDRKMWTPRHFGNRGIGNRLPSPTSPLNLLIPLTAIPKIAQKHSRRGLLPCVVFLKVGRWVETHRSVRTQKGDK